MARRGGQPDDVRVVVEGIGTYGAGVARACARAGYRVAEAPVHPRGDLRGKGKTDALDAVRILSEIVTRERTAATNALTALVHTANLGIDAHNALRIHQVRHVAGWRTRTDEPIDVRVARLEATRLARQVLDLRTQAKANER